MRALVAYDSRMISYCKTYSEAEAFDDDISKCTETTRRKCSEEGNAKMTPCLRVQESFFDLLGSELFILYAGLVTSNTFDDEGLCEVSFNLSRP